MQDDGFPIPSLGEPDWWWAQHKYNKTYKVEPEATEEEAKEAMKAASFAAWLDQRGYSHGQSCDIMLWWLENEDAAHSCQAS